MKGCISWTERHARPHDQAGDLLPANQPAANPSLDPPEDPGAELIALGASSVSFHRVSCLGGLFWAMPTLGLSPVVVPDAARSRHLVLEDQPSSGVARSA